ncbi:5'-nucleotidase [Paraliobacillus zengyii]|uniref:5'-nucleotidase n=1 Tax=Paraliobacillus zengyii TaxID=2213194 RepID=UPI000DD449E0|nr:5'-nucleotidase [Paraliobacillus zengyii]
MAFNFSEYLVIGISSRALFDLRKENEIYEKDGVEAYSNYQIEHEDKKLEPGLGFSLIKGILKLNEVTEGERKTEVVIMSRNNPDTSLRIFNSFKEYDLDIQRAALTSGASLVPYLNAFDVDLFLSADESDVQEAINAGVAAGLIYQNDTSYHESTLKEIRIAFDGDAVLFSDESEKIYKEKGLEAFEEHERNNAKNPLPEGPFAKLLKTLVFLQKEFGSDEKTIRTALVTARNLHAHERVIRTLRSWDIRIDEAFFLGGASKEKILEAFGAHIFFDDQEVHLSKNIPSARVPYKNK